MHPITVCALYKFVSLKDFELRHAPLKKCLLENRVRGTLLLASEGINGTIAGSHQGVTQVLAFLEQDPRLAGLETKLSYAKTMPFKRSKVKLKQEIVTMGMTDIDPRHSAGTYVAAKDWNELISDPDVTVLDCRNQYEVEVGRFKGAINPQTTNFRELPQVLTQTLDPDKHKKVAMYCTGGIRCEKSTAYLKQQGFEAVYHLKGGILKYLEEVPPEETLWEGECFVFDERVTVDHQLQKGSYDQCHACRMPITAQDQQSQEFILGVSCPHCFEQNTPAQKEAFAQRQKQILLAKQRGEAHMGEDASMQLRKNKQRKRAKIAANMAKQAQQNQAS